MQELQVNMYANAVKTAARKYASCFGGSVDDARSEMWIKVCEVARDNEQAGLLPIDDLAMRRTLRNFAIQEGRKSKRAKRSLYETVYASQKENATSATNADDILQDFFSNSVEQNVSHTLSVQLLFELFSDDESTTNRLIIQALFSDLDQCEIAENLKITPTKVSRSIKRIRRKFEAAYGFNPVAS